MAERQCLLCGGASGTQSVCAACRAELPRPRLPQCPQCTLPTFGGEACGACLKHPPAFDHAHATLAYSFPLDLLIPRLKYHGQLRIVSCLHWETAPRNPSQPSHDQTA